MMTLDNTSSGTSNSTAALTFSHTCSGMERLLVVGIESETNADRVTGVTYGGVAMTCVNKANNSVPNQYVHMYYLINPKLGANNVVVSFNTPLRTFCMGVSYRGATQIEVLDANTVNSNSGATSITTALTTVADHCWVVSVVATDAADPSASTGVTSRVASGYAEMGDSSGGKTPAGSYSMTWTAPATTKFITVQASFKQGGGSAGALLNML